MGRSDYLVSAGIGFDLDRASAKKSVGIFEGIAGALNTVATKKATEGFAATEKAYAKTLQGLKKDNEEADAALVKGTEKSAKAAQSALDKSMMKPPSRASKGAIKAAGGLKAYKKEYEQTVGAMKTSYSKFAKEAEKLGIKFSKGSKMDMDEFAKKDVETRKRAINLTKRMVKDEKARLAQLTKGSKGYKKLKKEIKGLEAQEKQMVNLSEDIYQQEKKNQNVKRKTSKEERKAEKKKIIAQKKIQMGLKNQTAATKRLGQVASASAAKIKAGLTNAFVIGTAAAMAFFYKMQPLSESVLEFEKTIINANSVFNVTKKELFDVSDSMVNFTLKYGVSAQDTATGLYQLASAGLSAAESQEVLQSTMKLAMATQGDHNTLAKLTVQTIMGFGMEMSQTEELTDKFAHSIQKSLIEWQDLASSVKFAMPFFVATGQSIDELLGGLEVLTNRALEAGIAGRGLRQALAQFAKHADDNGSALRKMGVDIMDAEGNMRALSAIATDAKAAFGDVTDLEALTAMLEDMNVRGATAFALLVQNADEYTAAVDDLAHSQGEAALMADIQQESLTNQIQLVKNALLAPFLFSDEVGKANNTLNEFTFKIKELVQSFTEFFIVTLPDGTQGLTQHSDAVKEFVIEALGEAVLIMTRLKEIFLEQEDGLTSFTELLHMAVQPLHILLDIMDFLGPKAMAWMVKLKVLNSVLPITNLLTMAGTYLQMKWMAQMIAGQGVTATSTFMTEKLSLSWWKWNAALTTNGSILHGGRAGLMMYNMGLLQVNATTGAVSMSTKAMFGSLAIGLVMFGLAIRESGRMSAALVGLASIMAMVAFWGYMDWGAPLGPPGWASAAAGTVALFAGMMLFKNKIASMMGTGAFGAGGGGSFSASQFSTQSLGDTRNYDSGGVFIPKMYESGGPTTEHGMAVLQKGETVIPKTRNMLEGGITLNIGGDIVTDDAEDFAERIANILPEALRRQSDIGGI